MIDLIPIYNESVVKTLLKVDDIYKECYQCEDLAQEELDFKLTSYLSIVKNDHPVGLIILRDFSHNCVTIHGGIYKKHRSKNTAKLVKECIDFIKEQHPDLLLMTTIPEYNKAAIRLAEDLNFTHLKTIKKGHPKGDLFLMVENI